MQNNPAQNIHTDYAPDDVYKPQDANALVQSVPYDYIITDEMLEKYYDGDNPVTTPVAVSTLFGGHTDDRKRKLSVMIAAHTTYANKFDFQTLADFFVSDSDASQELHVYSRAPWEACRAISYASLYVHSTGDATCVSLNCANDMSTGSMPMFVGSFRTDGSASPLVWSRSATFSYEKLVAGNPVIAGSNPNSVVEQYAWLSNSMSSDTGDIVSLYNTAGTDLQALTDNSETTWTMPTGVDFVANLQDLLGNDTSPVIRFKLNISYYGGIGIVCYAVLCQADWCGYIFTTNIPYIGNRYICVRYSGQYVSNDVHVTISENPINPGTGTLT